MPAQAKILVFAINVAVMWYLVVNLLRSRGQSLSPQNGPSSDR